MNRYWQNLTTTRFALSRAFPPQTLDAIEAAIRESERAHGAQLQFAIETALDFPELRRGVTARQHAISAFSELGVWDTEHNNGVLIYVLLAEHDIEIVADRGYRDKVSSDEWRAVCVTMEKAFAAGDFRDGSLAAIRAVTGLVAPHFPPIGGAPNERPDRPIIL